MQPIRLDKLLTQHSPYSRSDIKKLLKQGRVQLNGSTVQDGALKVEPNQLITLDDQPLHCATEHYFLLHKPVGYVCATVDEQHPTVLQLINEPCAQQLHCAGRLDLDTTGLVLLTSDGQWSHQVTSPRKQCEKEYWIETADAIDPSVIELFAQGMQLRNETQLTRPAHLTLQGPTQARLILQEGKYHQVKRMFAATGNKVIRLHRQRIGPITLDETLAAGAYRRLTDLEIQAFATPQQDAHD